MTPRPANQQATHSTASLERATDQLVNKILGWRIGPGRFLKPGRGWTPRSRFKPFERLEDVFFLLKTVGGTFVLCLEPDRTFTASILVRGRSGKTTGSLSARTIAIALCKALEIGVS